MLQDQEKCKTCGGKLTQRETQKKASQLQKAYYYKAYYFCAKCQKIYHNDKFKVINSSFTNSLFEMSNKQVVNEDLDVEIWTDGACVFNGQIGAKAAWSFVSPIKHSQKVVEKAGLVEGPKQTNNVAEAMAILHALEWAAKNNFRKIKIYSDSQITLHNLKKSAKQIKQNQEIFQKIEDIIKQYNLNVYFEKVLGHSGNMNNERADRLANKLAEKQQY